MKLLQNLKDSDSQKKLGKEAELAQPSVSKYLKNLEIHGFVERIGSRRELTFKGEKFLKLVNKSELEY